MDRQEFETLRDLPDKTIEGDIKFESNASSGPNLVFGDVSVRNTMGLEVVLNGTYKPYIPSVTFNFSVRGVGPICRICVNGAKHGDAGRTHKHDLRKDSCPRRNLPNAIARPDLENFTPDKVWETILAVTNITHNGNLTGLTGGQHDQL
jgi:hypothetical protein